MERIDISLSIASHEILPLTDSMPHPLFHNIYFMFSSSFYTLLMPFKEFVYIAKIPSHHFMAVDIKEDLFLGHIYDVLKNTKNPTSLVTQYPPCIMSKFCTEVISSEKMAYFDNLIPDIYFKNIYFHFTPKTAYIFVVIPNTELAIRIKTDNKLSRPNFIGIKSLINAVELNESKIFHPFVLKGNRLEYPVFKTASKRK